MQSEKFNYKYKKYKLKYYNISGGASGRPAGAAGQSAASGKFTGPSLSVSTIDPTGFAGWQDSLGSPLRPADYDPRYRLAGKTVVNLEDYLLQKELVLKFNIKDVNVQVFLWEGGPWQMHGGKPEPGCSLYSIPTLSNGTYVIASQLYRDYADLIRMKQVHIKSEEITETSIMQLLRDDSVPLISFVKTVIE